MSKQVLYDAITARTTAQVVEGTEAEKPGQLRFLLRVATGPATALWLGIVGHLLTVAAGDVPWTIDISKQYFLRNGQVRFGWRVIVQSIKPGLCLDPYLVQVANEVKAAQVQGVQIEEVTLKGSPNRRVGAYMGQAKVGPAALLRNS